MLKEGTPISSIKVHIMATYEVTASQLEKDWDDFCNQLKYANLLDN